jgi:hypothetical protein
VPPLWPEPHLATRNGENWKARFGYTWQPEAVLRLWPELWREAEKEGLHLIGFSRTDNPQFRGRKYKTLGKPHPDFLWVKDGSPYYPGDPYRTFAAHYAHYGGLLLCNYLRPTAPVMETWDYQALDRDFPGLFAHEIIPGPPRLCLLYHTPELLETWRVQNGYLTPNGAALQPRPDPR